MVSWSNITTMPVQAPAGIRDSAWAGYQQGMASAAWAAHLAGAPDSANPFIGALRATTGIQLSTQPPAPVASGVVYGGASSSPLPLLLLAAAGVAAFLLLRR
ncbi:MAG: hypothetical protein ABR586_01320 [Thermoplasmatota archaeon]